MTIIDKPNTIGGQGGSSSQEHEAGVGIMAEQMMQEAADKAIPAGYKQTEVGVIPEDWIVEPLENFTSFISYGFTNPMPTTVSGPFMITARDISNGKIQYGDARATSAEAFDKYLTPKSKPKKSDLLLTKDGTLGRLALVDDELICINQSVAILRPNERVSPDFFKSLLESPFYQGRMIDDAGGSTIKHIYITIVNKMLLGMPSNKAEQTAIANVLSDSDALIDALEQLIAKKQAIKSATMQQLLTGRTRLPAFALRPDGTPKGYKPSELGDIPEDWDAYKFDDIFYKVSTKKNQLTASEYMVHGIIPVVDQGKMIIVGYCDDIERMLKVDSSGVIVFGDHTCIVKYVDFNFIVGADGVQVIKGKVGFVTQFLYYAMSHLPIEPTGYNRHFSLLKESCYCIPAREEQTAITTILSDMDNELQALTQKLEKARALKQGMMQQLLTGKIRLPLAVGA